MVVGPRCSGRSTLCFRIANREPRSMPVPPTIGIEIIDAGGYTLWDCGFVDTEMFAHMSGLVLVYDTSEPATLTSQELLRFQNIILPHLIHKKLPCMIVGTHADRRTSCATMARQKTCDSEEVPFPARRFARQLRILNAKWVHIATGIDESACTIRDQFYVFFNRSMPPILPDTQVPALDNDDDETRVQSRRLCCCAIM